MNIDDLRLFIDVARLGSFAEAARRRNADPSAVSRTIAALEDEVGVRLLQRTTRRVRPSESGEVFLARIAILVDELQAAGEDARGVAEGAAGTLRLTASSAFGPTCLAPVLAEFRERHPQVSLDLLLSDEQFDLVEQRLDMAIRLGPADDTRLTGVKLFDTQYRVCASPAYLARVKRLASPADLASHRCLLFPFADFRRRWTFERRGKSEVIGVDGDLVTSSALTLRICALAGMGPSLLPSWLVDGDIRAGALRNLFGDYRVTATTFDTAAWILYPSRHYVPAKVRAMTEFLRVKLSRFAPQRFTATGG